MKLIIALSIGIFLASPSFAQTQEVVEVDIEKLVEKISKENYKVYEAANRVYQAKESITVARMNLLPRLNLWNLASGVVSIFSGAGAAAGAFSIVEDIAPFLVPANWFRVSQTELFYEADKEGYRALWANEVLTAKALYLHLLLDSSLREHIIQTKRDLNNIHQIVRVRETFGGTSAGVSQDIKLRLLALDEDARALEVLIAEEESLLAFMMGYPTGVKLKPKAVDMPGYDDLEKLDYRDFEFRAVDVSPEVRQYDYIIKAADHVRREIPYSFLGTSSMSRGINGGVFDSVPMQQGLGFGASASIRVVKSQKELLKVQKKGVEETIRRQLKLLIDNYNLDIDNYHGMKQRVTLSQRILNDLYQRIKFGEEVDSLQLIEASKNHIEADTALFGVMFRFLNTEDKLARLIFYGDYSKQPVSIADMRKEEL
jgi:outer membrane protein TolC